MSLDINPMRSEGGKKKKEPETYEVKAGVEDKSLGFVPAKIEPPNPILIAKVNAGSWAEEVEIRPGDMIIEVDRKPVAKFAFLGTGTGYPHRSAGVRPVPSTVSSAQSMSQSCV